MIRQLEPFIGKWNTTGTVYNEDGTTLSFEGTDTYEWLPNHQFIVHQVDVTMGDKQNLTTEILGVEEEGIIFIHAYEVDGTFSKMTAALKDNEWIFKSEKVRYKGRFSDGGNTMSGIWEKKNEDGSWQKWMDVVLKK